MNAEVKSTGRISTRFRSLGTVSGVAIGQLGQLSPWRVGSELRKILVQKDLLP
ncbi:MAG TPA: hypothetical protein VF534_13150 [Paraburkholderia sp.]